MAVVVIRGRMDRPLKTGFAAIPRNFIADGLHAKNLRKVKQLYGRAILPGCSMQVHSLCDTPVDPQGG